MSTSLVILQSNYDSEFEDVLLGKADYPLSLFDDYLKRQLADENMYFYRDADSYVKQPDITARDQIVQSYIREGAESQINIAYGTREKILARQVRENTPNPDLFNEARNEVRGMVRGGPYEAFIRDLSTKNLSPETAKQPAFYGTVASVIGLLVAAVLVTFQNLCNGGSTADTLGCSQSSVIMNRLWRLICAPFIFFGVNWLRIGYTRNCPICSMQGTSYLNDRISYFDMVFGKLNSNKLIKVDKFSILNRKKSFQYQMITIAIQIILLVGLLLLPPNIPEWY